MNQSLYTNKAMNPTQNKFVGIGNPSKYCDLPCLSLGMLLTEILNLANLVNPHKTQGQK